MTDALRDITVVYARSIYRAEVRFIEGDPARIEGIWLLAGRFNLGEAGLAALREAIEPVNALIAAPPELAFTFDDIATSEAMAASAVGALAAAIRKERRPVHGHE